MFGGAGIVDEDVEPAPTTHGSDDLPAILIARDVALDDNHVGAGLAAEIGGLFGFLLAVGIVVRSDDIVSIFPVEKPNPSLLFLL
jgi:hypothetical protein